MRIAIIAIGTHGDVEPLVALGLGLQAAGHTVRLATHAMFETFVRGRGLDFSPVAGEPRALLESPAGRISLEKSVGVLAHGRELIRLGAPQLRRGMADCWQACKDAEAIVVSPLGLLLGYHIAERLCLPLVRAYMLVVTPSRTYPADFVPGGLRMGARLNLLTHTLRRQCLWQAARPWINAARREVLDLPPLPFEEPFAQLDRRGHLLLYGFSPAVFPPPPDWGDGIHVTGYWFLNRPPAWQPPAGLVDFLQAGPPPIYVGFGSMSSGSPGATTALVVSALRRAGQRAILHTGWGGLSAADVPDGVFAVDSNIPFDWLFPRMAAVVHHGGAGTTAAGLRAGVPSVIVPVLPDQHFWGRRVCALGVGPRPIPRKHLSVDRLASALHAATGDQGMRRRAAALSRRILAEDGVAAAIEAFDRHLGLAAG